MSDPKPIILAIDGRKLASVLIPHMQCACVHPDRYLCIAIRTDRSYEEVTDVQDECQCYCHVDEDEDEYE